MTGLLREVKIEFWANVELYDRITTLDPTIFMGGSNRRIIQQVFSDGTLDTIGVSFSLSRTLTGAPNESQIVLSNVSKEGLQGLLSGYRDLKAKVFVRYKKNLDGTENRKKNWNLLFSGNVVHMLPEKDGVNTTLTLTLLDAYDAMQTATASLAVSPYTPLKKVVRDLALTLKKQDPDIVVEDSNICIIPSRVMSGRSRTLFGATTAELDALAEQYEFSWDIHNSIFFATMDAGIFCIHSKTHAPEISLQAGNLIKVTPEFAQNYDIVTAMQIETLLEPSLLPGMGVILKSIVYPEYNGLYKIHNLSAKGDTKGVDWQMTIDSKTVPSNQQI